MTNPNIVPPGLLGCTIIISGNQHKRIAFNGLQKWYQAVNLFQRQKCEIVRYHYIMQYCAVNVDNTVQDNLPPSHMLKVSVFMTSPVRAITEITIILL